MIVWLAEYVAHYNGRRLTAAANCDPANQSWSARVWAGLLARHEGEADALAGLPGILRWALDGLDRLTEAEGNA